MTIKNIDLYQMTEERQQQLWSDCLFVFDTSALLALYLYPEETRQKIYTEVFERIKDRLWIPNHVLFEYMKNRVPKIKEPITKSYLPLKEEFVKPMVDSFHKSLNRITDLKHKIKKADAHPYMVAEEVEKYETTLKAFIQTTVEFEKKFSHQIEEKMNEMRLLEKNDTVFKHLQYYFKVGREYAYEEIMQITLEGKHRYEFKIPPGYEDQKDKIGLQIFGDLIIWKQILEHSKDVNKNIVFICNDLKEDWWHLVVDKKDRKKKATDPRQELIKEIKDHSGIDFWMYSQSAFLELSNTLIKADITNKYLNYSPSLTTSKVFNKAIGYTCERCFKEGIIRTDELYLHFEPVNAINHSHETTESIHQASTILHCGHCKQAIQALFQVWEYPIGTINHQQIKLKGAILVPETPTGEAFQQTDYIPEDVNNDIDLETFVFHKKLVRLTSGHLRKINFPKLVDGNDTLFVIGYSPLYDKISKKQMRVTVYTADGSQIAKTINLEYQMTKFVIRPDEEDVLLDFQSIHLLSNVDINVRLSVIEYPGTGRYIEKLFY